MNYEEFKAAIAAQIERDGYQSKFEENFNFDLFSDTLLQYVAANVLPHVMFNTFEETGEIKLTTEFVDTEIK